MHPYRTDVTTAAASRLLTTLETVKEALRITTSTDDAYLTTLIAQQSKAAETFCKRIFAQETLVDRFELPPQQWTPTLKLSRAPVTTLTSVVEDDVTLVSADYELNSETGRLWRLNGSAQHYKWAPCSRIVVTFTAGFDLLGDLGEDIERAVIIMVSQAWFARSREPMLTSERVEGIGSFSWKPNGNEAYIPPEAISLLEPHQDKTI